MRQFTGLVAWLVGVAMFFLIFTYMAHGDTCCEKGKDAKCYPC